MDKKLIMKMNDTWKDFRLTESVKLFKDGAQHGFDLSDFKPGGFKKFLKATVYACPCFPYKTIFIIIDL